MKESPDKRYRELPRSSRGRPVGAVSASLLCDPSRLADLSTLLVHEPCVGCQQWTANKSIVSSDQAR